MKKGLKLFLRVFIVGLLSCAVFVSIGYIYLDNRLNPVQKSTKNVPYAAVPENTGIMFQICGKHTLCYFDFEDKILNVVIADDYRIENGRIAGYTVDYTVMGDYSLVAGIVECIGGIDIEFEGVDLCLTGVQVEELLSTTPDSGELRNTVTEKIILKISENGFKKEDFLYIIENSETNLTVPACYYWPDYMKELCFNARYIR